MLSTSPCRPRCAPTKKRNRCRGSRALRACAKQKRAGPAPAPPGHDRRRRRPGGTAASLLAHLHPEGRRRPAPHASRAPIGPPPARAPRTACKLRQRAGRPRAGMRSRSRTSRAGGAVCRSWRAGSGPGPGPRPLRRRRCRDRLPWRRGVLGGRGSPGPSRPSCGSAARACQPRRRPRTRRAPSRAGKGRRCRGPLAVPSRKAGHHPVAVGPARNHEVLTS